MVDKIVAVNEFIAGKGANSIKMNANFNDVVTTTNEIIDELAVMRGEIEETTGDIAKIVSAIYIGQIIPLCRNSLPTGVLPCNGAEYSRTLFPSFFRDYLLTGKIMTCSYDAYAQDIADYGVCGKFAIDGIKNTFKTPTLGSGCFVAPTNTSSEYGKYFEEGLPSIQHTHINYGYQTWDNTPAIVTHQFAKADYLVSQQTIETAENTEVSSIYGNSDHVTPKNIKYPYGVVVANVSETMSEINWNAFLDEIEKKQDKATITTDTTSTAPVIATLSSNTIRHYTQALTSLTITSYETSDISSAIWFTAGTGFTLTFTEAPLGYIPELPLFEVGKKYVLTINNGYVIIGVSS